MRNTTKGVISAVCAFVLWGLTPLYWSQLNHVPAFEVVLHRIWWSFPLLWGIILIRKARKPGGSKEPVIPSKTVLLWTAVAGALVTVNWLTYVWAVTNERTLEASLGYYINPLVSVALGTAILRERLDRFQSAAVIIASAGVVYLTIRVGAIPWVSLVLAGSFGVYGLIKKQVPVGATHSLALELIPLAPPALAIILVGIARGSSAFTTANPATTIFLIGAGAVTVVPLILFGFAARNIRLSDVGFVQYIAPTFMLLLGVFAFGENLDTRKLPGFILVWMALLLYSISSIIRNKRG